MYSFKRKVNKTISSILAMIMVSSVAVSGFASANEVPIYESEAADKLPVESQKGILSAPISSDQALMNYMDANKSKLGLTAPNEQLQLEDKTVDSYGGTHFLYQLQHDGIPVYGKYMMVHLNKTKRVSEIRNEMTSTDLPIMPKMTTPTLTGADAIQKLKVELENELGQSISDDQTMGGISAVPDNEASLIIYPFQGKSYLAYEVEFNFLVPTPGKWVAYVDANNGRVIDKYNSMDDIQSPETVIGKGKGRDANNTEVSIDRNLNVILDDLDDVSVTNSVYIMEDRSRGMYDSTSNTGVIRTFDYSDLVTPVTVPAPFADHVDYNKVNAHFYSGVVYEYYKNKFGRNSIDDNGMDLESIVNVTLTNGQVYDNASWNGSYMLYGNGHCYTCALDVIGHEITHGITSMTSALEYRNQSGALNESFSDIFGSLIEMDYKGTDNWLLGEDTGIVFRNMSDPSKYKDPEHMKDYLYYSQNVDNGGVHFNSGIPNYAAYLTATGIDSLGLNGKDILGKLSYDVLVNRLMPISSFEDTRDAFVSAAEDYVANNGADQGIIQKVIDAWTTVGLPYGQRHEIVSITAPGSAAAWIDGNSMSAFLNVPSGTNLTTLAPTITVSNGATLTSVDSDYSDGKAVYKVSSNDSSIKWTVYVASDFPTVSYTTIPFVEKDTDVGEIDGEMSVKYNTAVDYFNGSLGEDFIKTGKVIISPIPEGLEAQAILVGSNEIKIKLVGQATHHTNREDVDNLSVWFNEEVFYNIYKYMIADSYKNGFSIDFKHSLELITNTSSTVSLRWPQASHATSIQIVQSKDDGMTWTNATTAAVIQPDSSAAMVTGLDANSKYRFKLLIVGGNDEGESVEVSVQLPMNREPQVIQPVTNKVATVDGADIVLSLNNVFVDPDAEDTLTYTASSDATNIAAVRITGDVLTVDPVAVGTAMITITADDGHGHKVNTTFTVTINSASGGDTGGNTGGGNTGGGNTGGGNTGGGNTGGGSTSGGAGSGTGGSTSGGTGSGTGGNTSGGTGSSAGNGGTVEPTTPVIVQFSDIAGHWAEVNIKQAMEYGFVNGYLDGTFKPNSSVTRAEFAVMLMNAMRAEKKEAALNFTDAKQITAWASDAIAQAVKLGIIKGYSDGTFRPDALITRSEMAVMIANALGLTVDVNATAGFADDENIPEWANGAIVAVKQAGIIQGQSGNKFASTAEATRAEALTVLLKMYKLKYALK